MQGCDQQFPSIADVVQLPFPVKSIQHLRQSATPSLEPYGTNDPQFWPQQFTPSGWLYLLQLFGSRYITFGIAL
jgi:hypothetical protein